MRQYIPIAVIPCEKEAEPVAHRYLSTCGTTCEHVATRLSDFTHEYEILLVIYAEKENTHSAFNNNIHRCVMRLGALFCCRHLATSRMLISHIPVCSATTLRRRHLITRRPPHSFLMYHKCKFTTRRRLLSS